MKDDKSFLQHIIDEVNYILRKTGDLSYDSLIKDETLMRALLRSLEVIGEATKNISENFKRKYHDVNWREFAGLRDKLIHLYFGVNWKIVWDVVKTRIPELDVKLKSILKELNAQN